MRNLFQLAPDQDAVIPGGPTEARLLRLICVSTQATLTWNGFNASAATTNPATIGVGGSKLWKGFDLPCPLHLKNVSFSIWVALRYILWLIILPAAAFERVELEVFCSTFMAVCLWTTTTTSWDTWSCFQSNFQNFYSKSLKPLKNDLVLPNGNSKWHTLLYFFHGNWKELKTHGLAGDS